MKKTFTLNDEKIVNVKATNKGTSSALLGEPHYKYEIAIVVNDERRTFVYHDSIYNYVHGCKDEHLIENAVDAIISDAYAYINNSSVMEFINEFGYEDYAKGQRVYDACKKSYEKLAALLSDEEIEELGSIVRERY